jgi:hypothetical protein
MAEFNLEVFGGLVERSMRGYRNDPAIFISLSHQKRNFTSRAK